ncbi:MAG: hypothetical protein GY765_22020 [bacterium]|nr:hypothetical protein [bacterium]
MKELLARLLCIVLFTALPMWAGTDTRRDPQLGLEMQYKFPENFSNGYVVPTSFTFINRGSKSNIEMTLTMDMMYRSMAGYSSSSTLSLELPPGEKTVLLPLMKADRNCAIELEVRVDGLFSRELSIPFQKVGMDNSSITVLCVGNMDVDELMKDQSEDNSKTRRRRKGKSVYVLHWDERDAFENWRFYLGMKAVVIMKPETVRRLNDNQRRALKYWVCYGGGCLWLHGPDAKAALDLCAFPLPFRSPSIDNSGLPVLRCITGEILLSENDTIESVKRYRMTGAANSRARVRGLFNTGYSDTNSTKRYQGLFYNLHKVPRWAYIFISLLIAAVVGPVNYVMQKKKKKMSLFYITAPVLAIAGMLALGVYTVVSDGFGIKGNERAMLLHHQDANEGVVYHARGMFAGIAPRNGLQYPSETAAVPFYHDTQTYVNENNKHFYTDWTSSQNLSGSWLPGRSLCGLFTATPTRIRLGLKVTSTQDGGVVIENGLTAMVKKAYARVRIAGNDRICVVENVAPGTTAVMSVTEKYRMDNPFFDPGDLPWVIFAEMEAIPYMETGGIDINFGKGRYYYTAFNNRGVVQ